MLSDINKICQDMSYLCDKRIEYIEIIENDERCYQLSVNDFVSPVWLRERMMNMWIRYYNGDLIPIVLDRLECLRRNKFL